MSTKSTFSLLLSVLLLWSCSGTRNVQPSAIGLLPLAGYHYQMAAPGDTAYRVFRTEADFNAAFNSAAATARRPDFNGQTVVAVLLPTAPKETPLQFQRAEIQGNTMNVYAVSCAPGSTCESTATVLATTPRSGNVKRVQFFVNGGSRSIVTL